MKYVLKNLEVGVKNEVKFKIEQVDLEYDCKELAQFAANTAQILAGIKDFVKELAPVISREIEKHQAINNSFRLERITAEMEKEKQMQENWRERHASV